MNRRLSLLAAPFVLVLALGSDVASARTFTNTEGQSLEAQLLRADAETATLKLKSGRTATVQRSTLSEEDQKHITTWLAKRLPALRFKPNLVRSNRDERDGSSNRDSKTSRQIQGFEMTVDVQNDENTKGLEPSVMHLILVGRSLSDTKQFKILSVQSTDFAVAAGGKAKVPCKKVVNYYYDSPHSKSGFKCIGYVLYAMRKDDQREVYSHASTNQLKEALYPILSLKNGDVTDKTFLKASGANDGVIIVR